MKGSRHQEPKGREQWELLYRTPYTLMVGARLRRVRESRRLTQEEAMQRVPRPNGKTYSQGFLSRVEAGYANPPLYAYVHMAEAYELDPGRVMGSEETQKPITEAEMTLVKFLRHAGVTPHEAIARLAAP